MRIRVSLESSSVAFEADKTTWPFLRSLLDHGISYGLEVLEDTDRPAAPPPVRKNNGHKNGRSKCPTCGKTFGNLLGLEVHIGRVHKGSLVEPKAE